MDELNFQPVDVGHEQRNGIEFRFALSPVVIRRPVLRQFLHGRELNALRCIRDGLLVGPAALPRYADEDRSARHLESLYGTDECFRPGRLDSC